MDAVVRRFRQDTALHLGHRTGTAIRYTNRELACKGLYSIEVSPPQIGAVYDTILANL